MKTVILCGASMVLAGIVLAQESTPKNSVAEAAEALAAQANYAWTTTVVVPTEARWRPGPTHGKTEKDGVTHYSMNFFDNPVDVVCKGEQRVFTNRDGDWQTAAEAESEDGPGRFMARFAQQLQTPAEQAAELVSFVSEFTQDGDMYRGDLSEKGARTLVSFRRDADDSGVSDASGSATFWVVDGALTKYEFKVKGTVEWNGNSFDPERTTTVEIKDVGSTTVEVPEGAQKKLM